MIESLDLVQGGRDRIPRDGSFLRMFPKMDGFPASHTNIKMGDNSAAFLGTDQIQVDTSVTVYAVMQRLKKHATIRHTHTNTNTNAFTSILVLKT